MLLEHPEQAAELRDTDDPQAVRNAVEELPRLLAIVHNARARVAIEDVEIGGCGGYRTCAWSGNRTNWTTGATRSSTACTGRR
ncbi:hypothetical protein [Pseudonocardia abyssalis]|uniref:hypothetical protein n=1 Tax=Pseudonocardia abyssalis TaxID=2792008 RepID=UPI0035590784